MRMGQSNGDPLRQHHSTALHIVLCTQTPHLQLYPGTSFSNSNLPHITHITLTHTHHTCTRTRTRTHTSHTHTTNYSCCIIINQMTFRGYFLLLDLSLHSSCIHLSIIVIMNTPAITYLGTFTQQQLSDPSMLCIIKRGISS